VADRPLTVYGNGQQTRCFCNVKDAVRAVVALSQEPRALGEIFKHWQRRRDHDPGAGQRIVQRAGSRSEIQLIPYDQAYESGFEDMRRRVPSTEKINALVGWQPAISLDQTLDEVIAQFRASA